MYIIQRYGVTPTRLDGAIRRFLQILDRFQCPGSFPITAVLLERYRGWINPYLTRNLEFAAHGYNHIDYSERDPSLLQEHLQHARRAFANAGMECAGFRSPYLKNPDGLYDVLAGMGFSYGSNQSHLWDTILDDFPLLASDTALSRVRKFYQPQLASERRSLPEMRGTIVEIPVSLPDDEILLDRWDLQDETQIGGIWRKILYRSHELGELFTLQLHPERIHRCEQALTGLLEAARALTPPVWLARLSDVSVWWRSRSSIHVECTKLESNRWRIQIEGAPEAALMVRGAQVVERSTACGDGYHFINAAMTSDGKGVECTVISNHRPIVGVSPACPPGLISLLRQEGFAWQSVTDAGDFSVYLEPSQVEIENEWAVLAHLEQNNRPLVRVGRWPRGFRSALCVTGDIDALTIWDFGSRLLGK
jgi:peptidoglycan/xylan/chitin deacetylase (PgdA/CDA1 family)